MRFVFALTHSTARQRLLENSSGEKRRLSVFSDSGISVLLPPFRRQYRGSLEGLPTMTGGSVVRDTLTDRSNEADDIPYLLGSMKGYCIGTSNPL
jgi:hypothetical protein